MSELSTFSLITILGILPTVVLFARILFKNSITFYITSVFIVALVVVGNVAFTISIFSFEYIAWAMPIGIFTIAGIIYFLFIKIKVPLESVIESLEKLSNGEIFIAKDKSTKLISEYSKIFILIDKLNLNLNNYLKFTSSVKSNNLDEKFNIIGSNDSLGKALLEMRLNLRTSALEEKKRKEDEKIRDWERVGTAKIIETLRHNNKDLFDLSFEVLSDLVAYTNSNVGGIFLLEERDNDNHLELVASYAYDRRKFLKKRIEIKEGLVGACLLEQRTIYLTKVPDDYMDITTGLGGGDPKSILIVPLKIDEKVIGVMELASFKNFEKHEIDFSENISENIASMLLNLKRQKETDFLLEKRKEQEEQMSQQEEQLNMVYEELQSTQEEIELLEDEVEAKNEEIKKLKNKLKENQTQGS